MTAGREAILAEGATQERERIRAITSLEEANGRKDAALQLALNSAASPNEVAAVLAALPRTSTIPEGGRSRNAPIGLALFEGDRPPSAALSPEQVAANVNRETAR